MEKEKDELIHQLKTANKFLKRSTSARYQIYLSVVRGIGTAIGLTIVGGIIIGIMNNFIHSAYDLPIIGNILQNPVIQRPFEQ